MLDNLSEEEGSSRLTDVIIFLVLLIIIVFVLQKTYTERAEVSYKASGKINVTKEPKQTAYSSDPITKKVKDFEFEITPLAKFNGSFKVVYKKVYTYSFTSTEKINLHLAPVDLCVVWGNVSRSKYDPFYDVFRTRRGCGYKLNPAFPFSKSYFKTHFSNLHIIPANENILKAAKTIEYGNKISMDGFLVEGKTKNGSYRWKSSLTRTDEGEGACELFYVRKLRIRDKVYT